jgi:prevent-host-death family protein
MPKTISSNDAKQRWGTLIADVADQGEEVIVASHGKPRVVVMSVAAYEEVQTLREQKRRADALERLHQLHERVEARNQDLDEEEAIEFAVKLGRELIDDMAARGDITFERDLRKQ